MLLPAAASIAAGMSIAGTQNTTSEVSLATNGFNSSINAFASLEFYSFSSFLLQLFYA